MIRRDPRNGRFILEEPSTPEERAWFNEGLPIKGVGDAVTRVALRLGAKHCTPCEKRRQLLNHPLTQPPPNA